MERDRSPTLQRKLKFSLEPFLLVIAAYVLLIYNISLLETAAMLLLNISEEERKSAISFGPEFRFATVDIGWITASQYDLFHNNSTYPNDQTFHFFQWLDVLEARIVRHSTKEPSLYFNPRPRSPFTCSGTHTPTDTHTPTGTHTPMSISPKLPQTDSSQSDFLRSPIYYSPEPQVVIHESDDDSAVKPGNIYNVF